MSRLIPLSSLSAGRRNPRRVKPEIDAHRRLVASIRSVGLISPLTVSPLPDCPDQYVVIAGKRRLEALRTIYRQSSDDPKVKCEVVDVDSQAADAMSLAENFVREAMHPLDEAEAFAKLAHIDAKGVAAVAAEFGESTRYVRQRIKLAGLADEIKAAYRAEEIDTATAEVFSGVPASRQLEVWREVDGHVAHAQHAKNLIHTRCIDATFARFDVTSLPDAAVSRDLFSDRVLIDRQAFMVAQAEAIEQEQQELLEDGWPEVVVAERGEVFDRLQSMAYAQGSFPPEVQAKLELFQKQRETLEDEIESLAPEADDEEYDKRYEQIDEITQQESELVDVTQAFYDEATKANGTVFLLIDPDGKVHTEFRVPRTRGDSGNQNGSARNNGQLAVPTPADLSERQKSEVWVHETIAVRKALLNDPKRQKVLLVMMLHKAVQNDGLLVRADADPVGRYIENHRSEDGPGFVSEAWDELAASRNGIEPFADAAWIETQEAYEQLMGLRVVELDELLTQLTVQVLSGSLIRHNPLTAQLSDELGVEVRHGWLPGEAWLKGYKKIQLAQLMGELRGPASGAAAERMKKSELVASLATLFAAARAGKIEDGALAERLNRWEPSCLCREPEGESQPLEVAELATA